MSIQLLHITLKIPYSELVDILSLSVYISVRIPYLASEHF